MSATYTNPETFTNEGGFSTLTTEEEPTDPPTDPGGGDAAPYATGTAYANSGGYGTMQEGDGGDEPPAVYKGIRVQVFGPGI